VSYLSSYLPCVLLLLSCAQSPIPIVVFALDLMSTYEGEHTIFGLLGQANLTQNALRTHFLLSEWIVSDFSVSD
jgi:hypothetical protein